MSSRDSGCYTVVPVVGSGLGMQAVRSLPAGATILSETPIVVLKSTALQRHVQTDPELQSLMTVAQSVESPWEDEQWWPIPVHASSATIQRFAQLEYEKLSIHEQQRWMSLADAFSSPPHKLPGNVLRSNAFTHGGTGDNYLYERLSRANHSCDPNMELQFKRTTDGEVGVLTLLRDVAAGDALVISYLSDSDLRQPTEARRAKLLAKFNFTCECARCGALPKPPARTEVTKSRPKRMVPPAPAPTPPPSPAPHAPRRAVRQPTKASRSQAVTPSAYTPAAAVGVVTTSDVLETAQAIVSMQMQACARMMQAARPPESLALVDTMQSCAEALHATERARGVVLDR